MKLHNLTKITFIAVIALSILIIIGCFIVSPLMYGYGSSLVMFFKVLPEIVLVISITYSLYLMTTTHSNTGKYVDSNVITILKKIVMLNAIVVLIYLIYFIYSIICFAVNTSFSFTIVFNIFWLVYVWILFVIYKILSNKNSI